LNSVVAQKKGVPIIVPTGQGTLFALLALQARFPVTSKMNTREEQIQAKMAQLRAAKEEREIVEEAKRRIALEEAQAKQKAFEEYVAENTLPISSKTDPEHLVQSIVRKNPELKIYEASLRSRIQQDVELLRAKELEESRELIRKRQAETRARADEAKLRAAAETQLKSFQIGLAQNQERLSMLQQRKLQNSTTMYDEKISELIDRIKNKEDMITKFQLFLTK
jgi:hypothetical protein